MSEQAYCISWFWRRRKTNNPISKDEARRRHEKREEYSVAIGGFEKPSIIVEVVNHMVAVTFLDTMLRMVQTFKFQEKEPNRLFLTMAIYSTYCEATEATVTRMEAGRKQPDQPWAQFLADADRVIEGTSLVFEADNSVLKQYERFADPYDFREAKFHWETISLWEPYPKFGHYDHLLKPRDLPWGPGLDDM